MNPAITNAGIAQRIQLVSEESDFGGMETVFIYIKNCESCR